MIVISDTSCLSALFRIGELQILEKIFHEIIIPQKVYDELLVLRKFGYDISEIQNAIWLKIENPSNSSLLQDLLKNLDEGEAYAIALAIERKADLLIIDEIKGRLAAQKLNLNITGVAGILLRAKAIGIISEVKPLLDNMVQNAGFRMSQKLYSDILIAANE